MLEVLMQAFLYIISICLISSASFAQSCVATSDIQQNSQKILSCIKPECFSNEGFQDKAMPPEDIIQNKMKSNSADEAVYRLIFSEMLASYCTESLSNELLKQMGLGIAGVINFRIKKIKSTQIQGSKEKAVVFAKTQFRSSTGSCDVAKREEFLCPTKNPHWEKLWKIAQKSWIEAKKQNEDKQTANFYYFFKHFENSKNCAQYNKPEVFESWKKGKTEVYPIATSKELSECVRFFK